MKKYSDNKLENSKDINRENMSEGAEEDKEKVNKKKIDTDTKEQRAKKHKAFLKVISVVVILIAIIILIMYKKNHDKDKLNISFKGSSEITEVQKNENEESKDDVDKKHKRTNEDKGSIDKKKEDKNVQNHHDTDGPITSGEFKFVTDKPINYGKLLKKKLPIIGAYGSEGCGPCREFEPTLIRLNREFDGKAFIKYVDIWEHQGAQENIPVQVIPTQNFVTARGEPYNPSEEKIKKYNLIQIKDNEGKLLYTLHQGPMPYEDLVEIIEDMR